MTQWLILVTLLAAPWGEAAKNECFVRESGLDSYRAEWYCKHLRAAGAARLRSGHAYRLTYLPSFHPPRVVTAFVEDGTPVITGLVLSGKGGYEPGVVAKNTRRELSPQQWESLVDSFSRADLWDSVPEDERLGTDGSQWIIEARREGRYILHDVWMPDADSYPEYYKIGKSMLDLADIMPDRLY